MARGSRTSDGRQGCVEYGGRDDETGGRVLDSYCPSLSSRFSTTLRNHRQVLVKKDVHRDNSKDSSRHFGLINRDAEAADVADRTQLGHNALRLDPHVMHM